LADRSKPGDFDQKELAKGTAVELEHTKDRKLAREIAMDHLKEDPRYYSKLTKVHKEGLGRMMNILETVDLLSRIRQYLEAGPPPIPADARKKKPPSDTDKALSHLRGMATAHSLRRKAAAAGHSTSDKPAYLPGSSPTSEKPAKWKKRLKQASVDHSFRDIVSECRAVFECDDIEVYGKDKKKKYKKAKLPGRAGDKTEGDY
jgi:hypothetical protein